MKALKNYPKGAVRSLEELKLYLEDITPTEPLILYQGYGIGIHSCVKEVVIEGDAKIMDDHVVNSRIVYDFSLGDRNLPANHYNDNFLFTNYHHAQNYVEASKACAHQENCRIARSEGNNYFDDYDDEF